MFIIIIFLQNTFIKETLSLLVNLLIIKDKKYIYKIINKIYLSLK
jgi:hypothetical protein